MSKSTQEHRQSARPSVRAIVITVSDSRTLETDRGGPLIIDLLAAAGHTLLWRDIVADETELLRGVIEKAIADPDCDVILITGGTGISPRDRTPDVAKSYFEVELPGYGELFRFLSYHEIGAAALLTRANAGRVAGRVLFTMPGSPHAVELAMKKLILPDLAHLVLHARPNPN